MNFHAIALLSLCFTASVAQGQTSVRPRCNETQKEADSMKVSAAPGGHVLGTIHCNQELELLETVDNGWLKLRLPGKEKVFYLEAQFVNTELSKHEAVVLPIRPGSKEEETSILAAELRAVRNVCVVPPELPDGTPAYSDAGELAKVLRDYVNWEAAVCDVEYHAGRTINIKNRERYDAYFQLTRHDNTFVSSSSWDSRSVTAVFTPMKPMLLAGVPRLVEGRWGYTNNLWNPSEMAGLAKKIKKSMSR